MTFFEFALLIYTQYIYIYISSGTYLIWEIWIIVSQLIKQQTAFFIRPKICKAIISNKLKMSDLAIMKESDCLVK